MDIILLTLFPVVVIGGVFVLWGIMLVHALKHNIPNRILWIILLLMTHIVGGIVYYFAIYQKSGERLNKDAIIVATSVVAVLILGVALLALL